METDDVGMDCMMSEAFAPFILSFSRVTTPPYQLGIMFNFISGTCSEFKTNEEELRYLRAVHAKNTTEAQDARITQKRFIFKNFPFIVRLFVQKASLRQALYNN